MDSRKKFVLIGPVYPYKGGISHYTSLMYRALSAKNEVYMMSYKLQYPRILFKKDQKDFSNDTFKVDSTDFYINTANPLSWIATAKKLKGLRPDLVIIQWWHPYFAPCYWVICRLLKGMKILFVCHNVFPHERFPLDRFLTRQVLGRGNYFILHSALDEADLKGIKPDAVCVKTVHPTYNVFKFQNMSMEEGRRQLNIAADEKVLLFFGFVREYKGLKYLLQAMPEVAAALDRIKLLVVGDFTGDKDIYLESIQMLNIEPYVEIHDGYIPDREVEKFFSASDIVVLPYISATQSGIVQIAYGFEKPVLATNVGGLPDVVFDGKTGYLVDPMNPEAIKNSIVDFFDNNRALQFVQGIKEEKCKYSWEKMEKVITDLILEE